MLLMNNQAASLELDLRFEIWSELPDLYTVSVNYNDMFPSINSVGSETEGDHLRPRFFGICFAPRMQAGLSLQCRTLT